MKQGLREARSAGVFDAPSCALHRRSEINGQEGSGLLLAQAGAAARPKSRPRPRLRPRRGGALAHAAGPRASGLGEQARAAGPWGAGPGALVGARVNRPWAVAGSGRNGQINSKVTVFDFLIFQKTV